MLVEKKSLTSEQYEHIREFSRKIVEGINLVSCDFETRRQMIELLDIQLVCMLDDDGNKFVNLKWILASAQYDLSTGTHGHISDE